MTEFKPIATFELKKDFVMQTTDKPIDLKRGDKVLCDGKICKINDVVINWNIAFLNSHHEYFKHIA